MVHPDPAHERVAVLVRSLQQLGHPASVVADLRMAQSHSRDLRLVIVPEITRDPQLAEDVIFYLNADQSGCFLILVAETIDPGAYKRLLKTKRGEWVSWQSVPQELSDLVSKISSSGGEGGLARVVSFLPSGGGVGNTTLAVETGFCLASEGKKNRARVAVIDLNFQASTLADRLDLEPRLDISELVDRPERLDERLIDVFTSHHSPQLDVFSSPTRFDGRDMSDAKIVFSLLDGISRRYDFVLTDLPHHWSPWVDNVLQGSDAVVITGGNTVPAVRQLMKRVQHVDFLTIPAERTKVVVNQCQVTFLGAIPRNPHIERGLSRDKPIYVRQDATVANQAANTGRPMMELAPRRPICKSIRQIAQWARMVAEQPGRLSK